VLFRSTTSKPIVLPETLSPTSSSLKEHKFEESALLSQRAESSEKQKVWAKDIINKNTEQQEGREEEELEEAIKDIVIDVSHPHQHEKVIVKWWEWALSPFKKNDNIKVVESASKKVDEVLDVLKMMKRFIQLERLAYILLDDEQKIAFDNLPRPTLDSTFLLTNHEGQRDLLHKALENILSRVELSRVDIKLLELYENTV